MISPINLFSEDIDFDLKQAKHVAAWILKSASDEGQKVDEINYIFCSDNHLHSMNLKYLNHDSFTDIITFDLSDNQAVSSDIYISVDRIRDNAKGLGIDFESELHRVMIHGVLHLIGYGDKSLEEQTIMRSKEDYYLSLRTFFQT